MVKASNGNLTKNLKTEVESHPVLRHPWLENQKKNFQEDNLYLWLCQEFHVSVSFVDWFLLTASQTQDQNAKIILVQNIWEELGEGNLEETHVSILRKFLGQLSIPDEFRICLPKTSEYLNRMIEIVNTSFYHGLGALGPANEYLLKLEYFEMSKLYKEWKRSKPYLPEPVFFQVNLDADEGHAKRLFDLIQDVADTEEKISSIQEGNAWALDARMVFYDGLNEK